MTGDDPNIARIGTLADRLDDRLGRAFGRCRTCGTPTRSHRVGSGVQCHGCHSAGERVVAADGGHPGGEPPPSSPGRGGTEGGACRACGDPTTAHAIGRDESGTLILLCDACWEHRDSSAVQVVFDELDVLTSEQLEDVLAAYRHVTHETDLLPAAEQRFARFDPEFQRSFSIRVANADKLAAIAGLDPDDPSTIRSHAPFSGVSWVGTPSPDGDVFATVIYYRLDPETPVWSATLCVGETLDLLEAAVDGFFRDYEATWGDIGGYIADGGVPPAQQCTLPDCERPATDPEAPGSRCEHHADVVAGDAPADLDGGDTDNQASPPRRVPEVLHDLGEVAFPLPPRAKAADRPRTEESLYAPDDPVIEAYLEAGHNYGIACRGDVAYLDADDPDALAPVIDALPDTAWQVTGSRTGEGYFLRVPGLDEDIPLADPETGENIGHVKAAPQSYTVGPGSTHPSGNRYGPLHGEAIATVDEDDLREIIEPVQHPSQAVSTETPTDGVDGSSRPARGVSGDPVLSVYDVLSSASYPEETRVAHPFHASETDANFMVDAGGATWRCWRHDCTGNALHLVGIEQGIITCGDWAHDGLDTDTWRELFAAAREAGYDLPEGEGNPGNGGGRQHPIESCAPPAFDPQPVDVEARRADMAGPLFDTVLADQQLHVFRHTPGEGKTTTAARAAADRGEPHVIYFDKHEKAREFITDDATPSDYFHLKGTEQPAHDCCLDATVAAGENETPTCPVHGHPSEWARMCPVYERDPDDPMRERYEALVREIGPNQAHLLLGLDDPVEHPWHGSSCPWRQQFHELDDHERVAAVHQYATLASVRALPTYGQCAATVPLPAAERPHGQCEATAEATGARCQNDAVDESGRCHRHGGAIPTRQCSRPAADASGRCFQHGGEPSAGDERLSIIDETVTGLATDRTLSVESLTRLANALERVAGSQPRDAPARYTLFNLAAFARQVIDSITDTTCPDSLADLDPPAVVWTAYETYDEAAGHYVEREAPTEDWERAEALADAKLTYGDTILRRMQRDEADDGPAWAGEPLAVDLLLAAAVQAGLPTDAVMQAVALPAFLDACPWCHADLAYDNGARCCSSATCDWHELQTTVVQRDGEQARALAWIQTDTDDVPVALAYRELPLPSALPDPADTLVLDATAEVDKVAGLFDVPRDDVCVDGDDDLALPNLHVTQVLDGQYHRGTIMDALTDADGAVLPTEERRTLGDRIQRAIETAGDVHRAPLFVMHQDLIPAFDIPENGEVSHYHGTRGLNFTDCDAVMCIGAPHPDVAELRRNADLLAMGQANTFRVGGTEQSTRPDCPNEPVYRKLVYEDEQGQGRAVPTKQFTGLVGALFREAREHELVQAVHRIRPLLADDVNHAYLLTNVPTRLPIDEVCSFAELADPLEALLPVPDSAIDLLGHVRDVAAGDVPDGFRAGDLVERRPDGTLTNKPKGYYRLAQLCGITVSQRTVYNWIHELEAVGLLHPEDYEQHAGVSYTVDIATLQSALSVLSGNGGFNVAAVRRFRTLAEQTDGSIGWLTWAREVLGLRGDRCLLDPPPM